MSESANGPLDTRRGFLTSLWAAGAAIIGLFVVKRSAAPTRSALTDHWAARGLLVDQMHGGDISDFTDAQCAMIERGIDPGPPMAGQLAAHTRAVERQAMAVRESAERVERLTP